MSRKGLTKRGQSYREHIEGWTCDYEHSPAWEHPNYMDGSGMWGWEVWASRKYLACGDARTLGAARAAARAVVMERETRGLEVDTTRSHHGRLVLEGDGGIYYQHDTHWTWEVDGHPSPWGTAPTLAEARKAARETSHDAG